MITQAWLEAQVNDAIERVLRGSRPEDTRIELKGGEVKNIQRTARQLAAHANAARGEPIVWIIGLNENDRRVDGERVGEFSTWIAQIESCFSGAPPYVVLHRSIAHEGKDVLGIVFDTKYAPFVIKNPTFATDKDNQEFEVPWRYGTRAFSAKKSELVRILVPLAELPECELLSCELCTATSIMFTNKKSLTLNAKVYVISRTGGRVFIPFHRCVFRFRVAGNGTWTIAQPPYVEAQSASSLVRLGDTEAVVDGAGMMDMRANISMIGDAFREETIDAAIEVGTSIDAKRVVMYATLHPHGGDDADQRDGSPRWRQRN
jgi:hypothetical protein